MDQITWLDRLILRLPTGKPRLHLGLSILVILAFGLLASGLYLAPKLTTTVLVLIGLGPLIVFLLWHHPEFGLLALIFLTSSLIPADTVDLRLPIGGGLDLQDLVLIGMLGLLILQGLFRKSLSIPWWRVGAPLLVFLGFALFSAFYALFYQHVELTWVFSDLRALIFYCSFFVTAWAIKQKDQMVTVLIGVFFFADLIAGVLILQQFLGPNHLLFTAMSYSNWRVYDLQESGGPESFGMVRIMPPGVILVYFMMIVAVCLAAFTSDNRRLRIILLIQFIYLSFGILLTYTRALWIGSASAVGLVLVTLLPAYKAHITRYLVIGVSVLGLLFGALGTQMEQSVSSSGIAAASIERVLSILTPEETFESNSLLWRVFETKEGLRSVSEHPLLGVGLGNSYRSITLLQGEANGWLTQHNLAAGKVSRFTRFMHSSYLSITVKMGLPAFASFLWFCVALVVNSALIYKNITDTQMKSLILAVMAGFIGLMFWSIFHQHFIQTESTVIIGLMTGLGASIYRITSVQNGHI